MAAAIGFILRTQDREPRIEVTGPALSLEDIPAYSGSPYVVINNNLPPVRLEEDSVQSPFELYSPLDRFGRCGTAYANLCVEMMPEEERQSISEITPSGWRNKKYEGIDRGYLYNRCHLIAFELAGENANERNLITGTRYMNVEGMLPFENEVRSYLNGTNRHVLYRVTPLYHGRELVARGVVMEAWSVEDHGRGVSFYVFVYNVQPGIEINYANGESKEQSSGLVA